MKNNTFYFVIIFALVISVIIFVSNSLFDLNKNKIQYPQKSPCAGFNGSNELLIQNIESDNVFLNMEVELIAYETKLCNLKESIHPNSMNLIFKYPLGYCGDCIDEMCTQLEQLKDSIPCVNIIIIASGGFIREMRVKMLPYKDSFPVYLIPNNDLGLPVDKSNLPYLVFVNDAKTSKHTLVVGPSTTDLLKGYIQVLSKKYCKPM